tara:strand:+ start:746 stop:1294 length:549 start_codon:yes stop_codon:yes gene_type:complete
MEYRNTKLGFNYSTSSVIPRLTTSFISYLKTIDLKNKTLLELGSGDSTIYFSKIFKKTISYENNTEYLNTIKKLKLKNVNLFCLKKETGKQKRFIKHAEKADLIIIDNDAEYISRLYFAKLFYNNKNIKAQIVLDNGTWNFDAYMFLKENYYCRDFPGVNKANENTVTSLFFKKIKAKELIY